MTIHQLAARLGLRAVPDGDGWRLSSDTHVPLFFATSRGKVGGELAWKLTPCLDLAALPEEPQPVRGVLRKVGGQA